ncbi:choice-of-anchor D domain-containing protein [Kiritimatiellaeota bacterium B1221]|nr:choice-of-anchor D domain-containing protein [Kiritimatiellaeota bacterium B1221]
MISPIQKNFRYAVLLFMIWGASISGLFADGEVLPHFNAEINFPDATIYATAYQADGKLLMGGMFGSHTAFDLLGLVRLHQDGSWDQSFTANPKGEVYAVAIQDDGKILAGGSFTALHEDGSYQYNLARFHPDGQLDESFTTQISSTVNNILIQPDGRILVAGKFETVNGDDNKYIVRLESDGSVDSSFHPAVTREVKSIALRADHKILVGGSFDYVGGEEKNKIALLNTDGSLAPSFTASLNGNVECLRIQPDQKILVSGFFNQVNGITRDNFVRLNADGSLDTTFQSGFTSGIRSISLQTDGKILVLIYDLGSIHQIYRLLPDGSTDPSFVDAVSRGYHAMLAMPNGDVLEGGYQYSPEKLSLLANSNSSSEITVTGTSRIDWIRTGSSPEIEAVTFEYWDEQSWKMAGEGSRNSEGWHLTDLSLPASTWIRARGTVTGGYRNGSMSLIEETSPYGTSATVRMEVSVDSEVLPPGYHPLNFGDQSYDRMSAPVDVLITNKGDNTLTGLSLNLSGIHAAEFIVSPLPISSLEPGESTSVQLYFRPWGGGLREAEILIQSDMPSVFSHLLVLRGSGKVHDSTFTPELEYASGLALQPDGKILALENDLGENVLIRFHPNGIRDKSFTPFETKDTNTFVVQPDRKILLGRSNDNTGFDPYNLLVRLDQYGHVDPDFSPPFTGYAGWGIQAIEILSDGKLLIGGYFKLTDGDQYFNLVRLLPNGNLDPDFTPLTGAAVTSLARQSDDKIVFITEQSIIRLHADGTLDEQFTPSIPDGFEIELMKIQPDGKIILSGNPTPGSNHRSMITRFLPHGEIDASFTQNPDGRIYSITMQADGKILLAGDFKHIGGEWRENVARLLPDGSLDKTFDPDPNGSGVRSMLVEQDGQILLSGFFTEIGGELSTGLARVSNDPALTNLSITNGDTLTWQMEGSAPQLQQVTFDYWENSEWKQAGVSTQTNSVWQATGVSLPPDTWIRAQGQQKIGAATDSASLMQSIVGYGNAETHDVQTLVNGSPVDLSNLHIDFGTVDWQTNLTEFSITLSNNGSTTLSDISLNLTGSDPDSFYFTPTDTTSLSPGESLTVTIGFHLENSGDRSAVLQIVSGDTPQEVFGFTLPLHANGNPVIPSFQPILNKSVTTMALQPGNKLLVAGDFNQINGESHNGLVRFHSDGSIDSSFHPSISRWGIETLLTQADGKTLISGAFETGDQYYIIRLNQDGSVDENFNVTTNGAVYAMLEMPNGQIYIGGSFNSVNTLTRKSIARLHADGTQDNTFSLDLETVPYSKGVSSIVRQEDGKILLGGRFTSVEGEARNNIAQLQTDGSLDLSFNPTIASADAYTVNAMITQPDGKIILDDGQELIRLEADGSLDESFDVPVIGSVKSIALQSDGKIWVAGSFTHIGNYVRNNIARLHPDGRLDLSQDPNASDEVKALLLNENGELFIGGDFEQVNGQATAYLALLFNNPAISQFQVSGGNQIDWIRGGSAPKLENPSVSYWNESAWESLGPVERTDSGWQITAASLPESSWIRGVSGVRGGFATQSLSLIEKIERYGTGTFPELSVQLDGQEIRNQRATLDFGELNSTMSSDPRVITLTNNGDGILEIRDADILDFESDAFQLIDFVAVTLSPGESSDLQIVFNPTAGKEEEAELRIFSNDAVHTPFIVSVKGSGIYPLGDLQTDVNDSIRALAIQPDGKILIGGNFTEVNGQPRAYLARLNPDGSLDPDFSPVLDNYVYSIYLERDLNILVGGSFDEVNSESRSLLARLSPEGELLPDLQVQFTSGTIHCVTKKPNGKILISGSFTSVNGNQRLRIAQLNTDGSLDESLVPEISPIAFFYVDDLSIQSDDKIIISTTGTYRGTSTLGRLASNGAVDTTFSAPKFLKVHETLIRSDGKLYVSGIVIREGNVQETGLFLLNTDGSFDTDFAPIINSYIYTMALQADGKIIIGGAFTEINGEKVQRLAALNPDGSLDPFFQPNPNSNVTLIALDLDGSLLVTGSFSSIGGQARSGFVRALNRAPLSSLTHEDSELRWQVGGSFPELSEVNFDIWQGDSWVPLGAPERTADAWNLQTPSLSAAGWVRITGQSTAGPTNGGTGLISIQEPFGGGGPANTFAGWSFRKELPVNQRDPFYTSGPLEVSNLMAFAMNLDPRTAGPSDMPKIAGLSETPNRAWFRFRRNTNAADVTFSIQSKETLLDDEWQTHPISTYRVHQTGDGWEVIDIEVNTSEKGDGFYRLNLE